MTLQAINKQVLVRVAETTTLPSGIVIPEGSARAVLQAEVLSVGEDCYDAEVLDWPVRVGMQVLVDATAAYVHAPEKGLRFYHLDNILAVVR